MTIVELSEHPVRTPFGEAVTTWLSNPIGRAAPKLDRLPKKISQSDLEGISPDHLVDFTQACLREGATKPLTRPREVRLEFLVRHLGEINLELSRHNQELPGYQRMLHGVAVLMPDLLPPGDTRDNDLANASDPEGFIP